MAQIFPPWTDRATSALFVVLAGLVVLGPLGVWYYFSPEYTDVGYRPVQPVPFSHRLHAGELAIDCRYCHAAVEVSPIASVPPSRSCMNCHRLVGRDKPSLEPVRQSVESRQPIAWVRVHKLPDYAFFDHAAHLRAGVGCSTCHGNVATMDEITQVEPLSMRWCLECHRNPDRALRPPDRLTDPAWTPSPDQAAAAARLRAAHPIAPPEDCGACHH